MHPFRLFTGLFVMVSCSVFGQQGNDDNTSNLLKPVEVLPPAPNAAALGKYGGINFNLSSGTMSTSIPVYEYNSRSIKVPISLSYNSNGFKVDEIPSRTGVGWVLNAGGVITRTVIGAADEYATRINPPSFSPRTRALFDDFLEPISFSTSAGAFDAQPDRFSFNFLGYSGQFILDSSLTPVLLNNNGMKFEFTSGSSAVNWDFKVTNLEGVVFYFGGDSAREVTDKDVSGPTCGWDPPEFFPTAYYLTKIVHPNNDSVVFSYKHVGYNYRSNISQSVFKHLSSEFVCYNTSYRTCPTLPNTIGTCITWLTTSGVALKEINSTTGGRMAFSYGARKDVLLDSLISKIRLYQPVTDALIKTFEFSYQNVYSTIGGNSNNSDSSFGYRPFLNSFTEMAPDSSVQKEHHFYYNTLSELPKRMSFAQDDYGFYNGKTANTSLLPKPTSLTLQTYFPTSTANRSPDAQYAKKGLLSKIVYPTGGYDTIYYEGNTIHAQRQIGPSATTFSAGADSEEIGNPSTSYSDTFSVNYQQETLLYGSCTFYGNSSEVDPIHNKGRIYVYEDGNIIYQVILNPGQSISPSPVINLIPGRDYWIKVIAGGTKVLTAASFEAIIGSAVYDTVNKEIGGIRVQKVATYDGVSGIPQIKKYFYGPLSQLDTSSAVLLNSPLYIKTHTVRTPCEISVGNFGNIDCQTNKCNYLASFSTSQTNLYGFSGGFITYRHVTESSGENLENGGIEHTYSVATDLPGTDLMGDFIVGSTHSNQSITNGREEYTHIFKKVGGNFVSVQKKFHHYKDDARYDSIYYGYVVNRKLGPAAGCESTPPDIYEEQKYDVVKYNIYTNWSYVDTATIRTYSSAGADSIDEVVVYTYGNPTHSLLTKQSFYGSDGKLNTSNFYYPEDLTLAGTDETARQALVSRHILSARLRQEQLKNTDTISIVSSNYSVLGNGLVLPANVYLQKGSNDPVKRVEFLKYNKYGSVIEQAKVSDVKSCYIWDYQDAYPIAQVVNADSGSIAYTSFEADGKGNWNYTGTIINDTTSPTGGRCYNLSSTNPITKAGLNSSMTYIVSYWRKSSQSFFSVNVSTGILSGREVDGWKYFEHEVTGTTTVTISGTGYIDEVRLYPKDAMMTTYTYKPLVGMTSQCDANSIVTYYEYDGFGRLRKIKDQDKNILKVMDYKYQTSVQQ